LTALALAAVENELNAFDLGQTAGEVVVQRRIVPRDDDEENEESRSPVPMSRSRATSRTVPNP
jgi:hypothetical protein